MLYHRSLPPCNGLPLFDWSQNQPDVRHRRGPSLACRLIAHRYGLSPATAATIARVAGFPASVED